MGPSAWRVIGQSVQGATHLRVQKPNQDAIAWYPDEGHGLPLIVAVADGHGSEKHFRSHIGAGLAARAAIDVLREFGERLPASGELMMVMDHLPAAIERRWKRAVDDHLTANPLGEGAEGPAPPIGEDPTRYIAYGTTLLSVLVTGDFIVYLQLGDGDILTVSQSGDVERVIEQDPGLIANETTSLCLPQARRHFRKKFQKVAGASPALVLLSTDGYANSFEEGGFLKAGADYLHLIRTKGIDHVNERLGQWLLETSQQGSGDDITVGIVIAPEPGAFVDARESTAELDQQNGSASENAGDTEFRPVERPAGPRLERIINSNPLIRLQQCIWGFIQRSADAAGVTRWSGRKCPCRGGRGGR
jgi:hypothetical protein